MVNACHMAGVRRLFVFAALAVALFTPATVQAENWGEKLGFPAGKRVLILHADDVGMCYEANDAAKKQLTQGDIQSAAMMVPCPWFNEIANWYKEHPDFDMGLHLAMNSEWKWYRWAPQAGAANVPGMVDPDGYLWNDALKTAMKAKPEEIEKEIRAQIERALSRGIKPSHIDTHMGTLYARPDFTAVYLKLAEEYRIPAMALEPSDHVIEKFRKRGVPPTQVMKDLLTNYKLPKLDDFDSIAEGKTYEEKRELFYNQVRNLRPGITEIIFHPSTLSEGMKHTTGTWQQRAWEAEMFSDPEVKQFLEREGILFTNWKDMMKRWEERFGDKLPKNE